MITTAITQLKASLSEYLAHVKSGEEIIVTDRGKAIAKVIPIKRDVSAIPSYLADMERAGAVKIGLAKIPADIWRLPRPQDKKSSALKALSQERSQSR